MASKKAAKAAKKPGKISSSSKPRSQGEIFRTVAEQVGLARKDVAAVFETVGKMVKADLSRGAAGVFKVPGLVRITVKRKPATKERIGINPFTKEQMTFKAQPARNVVRVRPVKALKEMVS